MTDKSKWKVIITTRSGQTMEITSDVPISKSEAITNAIAGVILVVRNSVDKEGDT